MAINQLESPGKFTIHSSQQLHDLAFNLKGWAMEDRLKDKNINQLICAYEPSSTLHLKIIENAKKDNKISEIFKKDLTLSAHEVGSPDKGVRKYP
jgi:hypothetical protein